MVEMREPTQRYSDLINSLQSKIQALEDENRLLKERLSEAGVSYEDIVPKDAEGVVELYDPNQGARIKIFEVTDKIASDDTLTGIVDVAMIRSLKKKDVFHPMLKNYAQEYFDECHHAASDSAIEVLQEINAKYVYGVTATPKRGDGKEKINEFG